MVQDDTTTPATKNDVHVLRKHINLLKEDTPLLKKDLNALHKKVENCATKPDFQLLQDQINTLSSYVGTLPTREEMHEAILESQNVILLAIEQIRHDVVKPYGEQLQDHDARIVVLERVTNVRS